MKKTLFAKTLAGLLLPLSAMAGEPNRVANGDFEKTSANGWADGWVRRGPQGMWEIAKGSGTDGSSALVWKCADADAGRMYVARQVSLRPGSIYHHGPDGSHQQFRRHQLLYRSH